MMGREEIEMTAVSCCLDSRAVRLYGHPDLSIRILTLEESDASGAHSGIFNS
jgi:hypothetical protein